MTQLEFDASLQLIIKASRISGLLASPLGDKFTLGDTMDFNEALEVFVNVIHNTKIDNDRP